MPLWESAQQDVFTRFGAKRWHAMRAELRDMTAQY
jgi:hypothetical protein